MAPKKKGGKKQADDWEADLGETIDPIAQASADAQKADGDQDGAEDGEMNGGGGLLAALRKNKEKRAKKGKAVLNDFVEGEDADGAAPTPPTADLDAKAPTEATFDDNEEDVFAGNVKKGKGGKKQQETAAAGEDDGDEGGGVKSKKEKEREKKEREKQRKREQVSDAANASLLSRLTISRPQRRRR
jgi:translation initiation factor 5B